MIMILLYCSLGSAQELDKKVIDHFHHQMSVNKGVKYTATHVFTADIEVKAAV